MNGQLRVQTRSSSTDTLVTVEGELDLATASTLEEACSGPTPSLVLDLSGVGFIDIRGLAPLISLCADHPVRLLQPSRMVRRLIELTDTQACFEILDFPTDDQILA